MAESALMTEVIESQDGSEHGGGAENRGRAEG